MSKQVYQKAFIQQLLNFVTEFYQTYPELVELKKAKAQLEVICSLNHTMVINTFMKYANEYEEKISNKDETFFMNFEDIQNEDAMDIIKIIKDLWKDMTPNNKESVWKYLQVLIKIGKKSI